MGEIRKNSAVLTIILKVLLYFILIFFTVMAIYPIIWLFIQSFKTNQDYMLSNKLAPPSTWFVGNYQFVWIQVKFYNFFINSVIYATITTVIVVLLSNMAGFAFAKFNYKITKLLHGLFIVGILLTLQSILIPLFLMINAAGLFNTRLGILIPYVGLGLPMGVYLATDFVRNIPDELIESARIDGASYLNIFRSIIFPMCAPVSVTLAIVSFTGTWNEFILMNLLTAGDTLKSVPAAVGRFAGNLGSNYGRLFVSLSISLIPILIFYFIFRKQITKGVAAGAVKG
ncbi:MAG: carbohydrate ABC transporter permease [Clostridiales bacterium]|jgi:raffinose/stachyose/melibiose transport system permease protein|nr:carbohydrate ABC transporter permease [Clostridiales bacterium]